MKRITFLALFLIFAGFSSKALAQSNWRLGLKFNPIISWARITDEDKSSLDNLEQSSKLGFSGGLMADYNFSDRAALHTGLLIVRKGYEYDWQPGLVDSISVGREVFDGSVTAVEIPLALKMRSGNIGTNFRIRGVFGGALGLNVAANTTVSSVTGVESDSRKVSDFYQPITLDFLVGLGGEYDIETVGTIDFGASYHNGLLRFDREESTATRALLHYFSFDLGFYF